MCDSDLIQQPIDQQTINNQQAVNDQQSMSNQQYMSDEIIFNHQQNIQENLSTLCVDTKSFEKFCTYYYNNIFIGKFKDFIIFFSLMETFFLKNVILYIL